ncbi:MAG: response regulator transcription factor [Actinomycetota bacterium]|nr:response regulator [Actinomycetota bacterium]
MANILVVDDEPAIRQLISFTLTDAGHMVDEAGNGEEAIDFLKDKTPDLILLDVMMPKIDGWAVLRELRRTGLKRSTRVVLLTAKSAEADFVNGWRLGVDEYLTKPFDPEDLAITVNQILLMSTDQIQQKRLQELEKSNLLSRIESAFGEE